MIKTYSGNLFENDSDIISIMKRNSNERDNLLRSIESIIKTHHGDVKDLNEIIDNVKGWIKEIHSDQLKENFTNELECYKKIKNMYEEIIKECNNILELKNKEVIILDSIE